MRLSDIARAREIAGVLPPEHAAVVSRVIDRAQQSLHEDTRSLKFSAALAIMAQRNGGTLEFTQGELESAPLRTISGPGLIVETQ